jgi:hypothetical protein
MITLWTMRLSGSYALDGKAPVRAQTMALGWIKSADGATAVPGRFADVVISTVSSREAG